MKFSTQPLSYMSHYRSLIEKSKMLYTVSGTGVWRTHVAVNPDCTEKRKDLLAAGLTYAADRNWPVLEMPYAQRKTAWGRALWDGTIYMNPQMPNDLEVLVLIHEMAHHDVGHTKIGRNNVKMKRERELVAEAIAYLVLAEFGVRKFRRSSNYIVSYYRSSTGANLLQLAADRQESTILRSAQTLYEGMSQYLDKSEVA